jgi:hypothetical protein
MPRHVSSQLNAPLRGKQSIINECVRTCKQLSAGSTPDLTNTDFVAKSKAVLDHICAAAAAAAAAAAWKRAWQSVHKYTHL